MIVKGRTGLEKEHILNTSRFLSILIAAMLVSATAAFPLAQAQGAALQVSGSPEVVRACTDVERSIPENSLRGASACAEALQASL